MKDLAIEGKSHYRYRLYPLLPIKYYRGNTGRAWLLAQHLPI